MVILTKASTYGQEKLTVDKKDLGRITEKLEELFGRKDDRDSIDLDFKEIIVQTSHGEIKKRVVTLSYYPIDEEKKKKRLFG